MTVILSDRKVFFGFLLMQIYEHGRIAMETVNIIKVKSIFSVGKQSMNL